MGMAPPLSYAYGDRKIDVCRKLEQYAHRFFAIAPLVIYALTYFLAPVGVSCFANTASPVFPIAVSGMRIYGLGFLFSGINIYAAVRMMAYGKGYFSGLITFLRSFALLLLFLTVLPEIRSNRRMACCSCGRSSDATRCSMVSTPDSTVEKRAVAYHNCSCYWWYKNLLQTENVVLS